MKGEKAMSKMSNCTGSTRQSTTSNGESGYITFNRQARGQAVVAKAGGDTRQ